MTLRNGQPVHLSFSDWMKLIALTSTVIGGLIAVLWRQESLIRDVAASQELLEYRVTQLEREQ
ncbi:MAG: hypothetical protein VKK63_12050 [Synechococcus sp.]|nr:hypothetical protein [Synechococcus sp.]